MSGAVFYLHGFASSAASTKAAHLAERFRRHDVRLQCPDFNEPDFSTLTFTRMLDRLDAEMAASGPGPATLIGSSLGGTLAVLAAARFGARVGRLVLLAPAVMFAKEGHHLLPPGRIDEWRTRGQLPFFHYAYNAERMLDYAFYDDSLRYNPFDAEFAQPTIIFQGMHDRSVDHRTVEAFARARPNVALTLLDDDHQLVASLPTIWNGTAAFLGLE
ncbi:MAG: YqiA/YcfP family alpha/beta fold hydrolase [Acidobacteriota bacterium]